MSDIKAARGYLETAMTMLPVGPERDLVVEAYKLMWRTKRKFGRSDPDAKRVTKPMVQAVKKFMRQNPDEIYRNVGAVFGVDGGRISEIMTDKRTEANPGGAKRGTTT